eukprot:6613520-Alexandrium_andersonii.AAC.1
MLTRGFPASAQWASAFAADSGVVGEGSRPGNSANPEQMQRPIRTFVRHQLRGKAMAAPCDSRPAVA